MPPWIRSCQPGQRRQRLSANDWDVGKPMQAYARPTGKEKSTVYNEESQKWEEAPVPEKGAPEEEKRSSVHLKMGPGMAVDGPRAKKGSMSSTRDPAKGVELKSASEVEMEGIEKESKGAEGDAGEKQPHTPRSGLVLKSAEEVPKKDAEDPGEKAPRGDSSDEEDEHDLMKLTMMRMSDNPWSLRPR